MSASTKLPTLHPLDLNEDIHDALKAREANLKRFRGRSPHLSLRQGIVEWMELVCRRFRLHSLTLHTAVRYYDNFTDSVNVPKNGLKLAALASVMLGAKWEEKEVDIPTLDGLLSQTRGTYTRDELRLMEMVMLEASGWNMTTVVSQSFVEYYIMNSITPEDTVSNVPAPAVDIMFSTIMEYASMYLGDSLKSVKVHDSSPSVVAACAVACARKSLAIAPVWPASAATASGLQLRDLVACAEDVFGMSFAQELKVRVESPVSVLDAAMEMAAPPRIMSPIPFGLKSSPHDVRDVEMYAEDRESITSV